MNTPYGAYILCAACGFLIAILLESIWTGIIAKIVSELEPLPPDDFDPVKYSESKIVASGTGKPRPLKIEAYSCMDCLHTKQYQDEYPCSHCIRGSQFEVQECKSQTSSAR